MQFLLYLSQFLVPLFLFYIIGYGMLSRLPVFDLFTKGAKEGVKVTFSIFPSLLGLMVGVGVLRASGFLDWIASILSTWLSPLGVPGALWPLILIRPFSTSAATGLLLDLFKRFGTDSFLGYSASILMSCTESIFYTLSIYFSAVKVRNMRYTLAGALPATIAGIIVSLLLANHLAP